MSRIGKQIIVVPEKVEVSLSDDGTLTVKGPHGELSRCFGVTSIAIHKEGNEITSSLKEETAQARMLWGTYMSHIRNMIDGVVTPFQKKLIVEGVGYRAEVSGTSLKFLLGYSHPVLFSIPNGLTVTVEKNNITISGIDKEVVGQFAAKIRDARKPEPYKGKGIRYENEIVRRKQGKKSVT
ncbi:MAG: 50S ribosomal protein L6 [Candidatus Lloydbacteria bacterium CG22_combo_CG10-13_8_21_14_all_47_15]|uniref:Large ribosomal subunit protein uL6 n=1 Tax=Candidatus Lloydbacteria bacterium CG22_combo_CG10-13_8_21_14_all_47_15 TaxID=1974635 RepID=A0A2H0CV54_9BACT|nr:MAG: 50S ribosomal protein L6 [Candidatus Lloydbacteria bacterium CG22_combo_CG10-13_8_21_14_all_47_15]